MSISLSFCPEPGGGPPWLKPLAGTLSTDEDTRPPPATIPPRIDNLRLLRLTPEIADRTREQAASYGSHSPAPDCSAVPVDCKTNAEQVYDFKDIAEIFSNGKRMTRRIEWPFHSGQGKSISFSDDDAGKQPSSSSCLSDFMVDDISGMAPSNAQLCDTQSGVDDAFHCLHPRAYLSPTVQVMDAFRSETMENVRSLKAPLLGDSGWDINYRGRKMESMVCDGNNALLTMRKCLNVEKLETTGHFEQGKMSRSSYGAFWTVKHLADLIAQLLSLLPYSTFVMVRSSHQAMLLAWSLY